MKKMIEFSSSLICGELKDEIIEIIPELKDKFTQRKDYNEYYVNLSNEEFELNLEQIEKLSDCYEIFLNWNTLKINAN